LKIIAGYNIFRFDPANPTSTLTSTPYAQTSGSPPPASFTDTGVVPGTRYGYFVTAVDSFTPSNQSSYSNVIEVTAQ
jgi:hypothetical protein